jgi:AraC-like DNA-binding protein
MTPEEIADLAHLRRARDFIDRRYAQPLDVPAMARAALMSPAHFSRKFRAAYGETPYAYLMTRRIERAKALLRLGRSVSDTLHRDRGADAVAVPRARPPRPRGGAVVREQGGHAAAAFAGPALSAAVRRQPPGDSHPATAGRASGGAAHRARVERPHRAGSEKQFSSWTLTLPP